jgi:hypothetical protein
VDEASRARIIEAERRLRRAQLHSDVTALDELLSPDLMFTAPWGQLTGKEDDLALHRAGSFRLDSAEPSEEHIQHYEGFSVVSVLVHLRGVYEGAPLDARVRYTRVWLLPTDGSPPRLVAGHATAVGTP